MSTDVACWRFEALAQRREGCDEAVICPARENYVRLSELACRGIMEANARENGIRPWAPRNPRIPAGIYDTDERLIELGRLAWLAIRFAEAPPFVCLPGEFPALGHDVHLCIPPVLTEAWSF